MNANAAAGHDDGGVRDRRACVTLVLLFTVIEFGRILFTLNVLDESARRAARVAAVCAVGDAAIAQAATFVGLPDLSTTNVVTEYLDDNGSRCSATRAAPTTPSIEFVRVRIVNYSFPGRVPADCHRFRGAGDFVHVAARESGRAEFRRGAGLLRKQPGTMAQQAQGPARQPLRGSASHPGCQPRSAPGRRLHHPAHQQRPYGPAARCAPDARRAGAALRRRKPGRARDARPVEPGQPPASHRRGARRQRRSHAPRGAQRRAGLPRRAAQCRTSSWPRSSGCATSRGARRTPRSRPTSRSCWAPPAASARPSSPATSRMPSPRQTGAPTLLMDLDVNSAPLTSFLDLTPGARACRPHWPRSSSSTSTRSPAT